MRWWMSSILWRLVGISLRMSCCFENFCCFRALVMLMINTLGGRRHLGLLVLWIWPFRRVDIWLKYQTNDNTMHQYWHWPSVNLADQDKIFTGGTHHERSFVGGSMAHPNKSKIAAASIFNFGKISITPDWIKISALNFMGRCIEAMQRWPRDQKLKLEVSSRETKVWSIYIVDLSDSQDFPRGTNFYQKLPFSTILGAVNPQW